MTLPAIITPPGTAEFLATGHDVTEDSVYAQWKAATGHSRTRRVWTVTEREVGIEWFLEAGQLEAVEEWFETTLQAGVRTFSARIRNETTGPLLVWWEARWTRIEYEMLPLGRAHVTGSLMLFGEGSVEPPEFGLMAAEFLIELRDVRATVYPPAHLAAEFLIELIGSHPSSMAAEFLIELGIDTGEEARITEDGETRLTEDGETRITET
jgi:hypothetical protein